jgi:hypothetical protein
MRVFTKKPPLLPITSNDFLVSTRPPSEADGERQKCNPNAQRKSNNGPTETAAKGVRQTGEQCNYHVIHKGQRSVRADFIHMPPGKVLHKAVMFGIMLGLLGSLKHALPCN